MLTAGQTVTYLRRVRRGTNLPQVVRASTIYNRSDGTRETTVFNQKRKKFDYYDDWYNPEMDTFYTRFDPKKQHEEVVKLFTLLGYKIRRQDEDRLLNEIPVSDLLESSKKQWDQWEFLKFLKETGRI